jgi:branched-chain amino acid transport system permease protein
MPRYLRNLIMVLLVIAVLYGLDFVFQGRMINPYYSRIIMLSGIAITLAVSLNLINGFTGQFSRTRRLHGRRSVLVGLFLG